MPTGPKAERRAAGEPINLLADTRRSLAQRIRQLEPTNNGVPSVPGRQAIPSGPTGAVA